MYCKRILILNQCSALFSTGKEICGMVKFLNSGSKTTVTTFVTNAKDGNWWLLVNAGGSTFARKLSSLNNDEFTVPEQNLSDVACLLVRKEDKCFEVCNGAVGDKKLLDELRSKTEKLVSEDSTKYEEYVSSVENYYPNVDVKRLKEKAGERYKKIEEYSNAFERYYATGGINNYYQSVKSEISAVFVAFPPYYPLMQKYRESYFVRIDFPSANKFFVLGVLQEKGVVRYICYGLPANGEISDKDFVYVDNSPVAFWMLFQDAETGQITTLGEVV